MPRVYRELRRLAGRCLRNERAGQTLQVTDLVHEAYLHLADATQLDWQDRTHFFAVSATLMRRILVDRARRRTAAKRGGRVAGVDIEQALDLSTRRSAELVALDDALKSLADVDPRKARIVELRFFGGTRSEGDGRGGGRLVRDSHARLEDGQGVAAQRAECKGLSITGSRAEQLRPDSGLDVAIWRRL